MADTLSILNNFNVQKSIGGINIDAFTTEDYDFNAMATTYPVEEGSEITDHIIVEPDMVSATGIIGPDTVAGISGTTNRVIDVFNAIKDMMVNKELITIVFGLKIFENMYIKNYKINRTAENGRSLEFNITFENIRIVRSQTTTIPNSQLGGETNDELQAQNNADLGNTVSGQTQQEDGQTWYDEAVAWVDENLGFLSE